MAKSLISNPIWGPQNFFMVLPLLVIRQGPKLSSYAISRKTNKPNLRKWQKNPLVLGPILAHLSQIRAANCFLQNPGSVSHWISCSVI